MKLKKLLQSKKGMTGILAILVLTVGIGTITLATNMDRSIQESKIEEAIPNTQVNAGRSELETTNAQAIATRSEEQEASKEISNDKTIEVNEGDLKGAKIICDGEMSEALQVQANEVAKHGVEAIKKNAGIESLATPYIVTLKHMDYSGLTKEGFWKCIVEAGEYTLYEINVEGKDFSTKDYKSYARSDVHSSWSNEKNEIISETQLPTFKKISIDLLTNTQCVVSNQEQFSLNLNREYKGYRMQYEVKGDTLYIKETKEDQTAKKDGYSSNSPEIIIGIPQDVVLESIDTKDNTKNVAIKDIEAEKVNLKADSMSIEVKECKVDTLTIDVANSSINIENAEIDSCTMDVANGSFYIAKSTMADCKMKVTNGSIDFGKDNAGKITAELINGSINYEEEKSKSKCEYDVSVVNGYSGENGSFNFGNFMGNWSNIDSDSFSW